MRDARELYTTRAGNYNIINTSADIFQIRFDFFFSFNRTTRRFRFEWFFYECKVILFFSNIMLGGTDDDAMYYVWMGFRDDDCQCTKFFYI